MIKLNKQIHALKQASQMKKQNTLDKVIKTFEQMKANNLPINFGSVAKLSGVSKTWLYKQDELKNQIHLARKNEDKIKRVIDQKSLLERQNAEIVSLKSKNHKLKETVKKLRRQLEVVYGELYNNKNKL